MHMTEFEPGQFCWVELATGDREAAIAFYSKLFGWTATEIPIPGDVYVILKKDGKSVGALYHEKNAPSHWNNYVNVTSVDAATEKAKSLGGSLVAGPFDVMEAGRLSVIADPGGAIFSLWEGRATKGVELFGEAGALCWNELTTHDAAAAKTFYTSLFGWAAKGDPQYTEWHIGQRAIGGMMEMKSAPTGWLPYFMVDDCDGVAATAKANGGRVYKEPATIEHVGRFAILADPQGAVFAIIQISQAM